MPLFFFPLSPAMATPACLIAGTADAQTRRFGRIHRSPAVT
ncbi:hypothetical protein HMPREF0620_0574 [Parascardovia denticolens DSM 10105 = JCM 12538]|uniref:Uncharacterized protein n=1 Tax=Parascardovia denticolens DSM 10105 = JCM 12538 TaxID=864564 RepID=E6K188_PARDN|nr:hypothetical protein HMPREF0620_0574 [Parascardovia denticolens DSM 10105 = JCM 12538]